MDENVITGCFHSHYCYLAIRLQDDADNSLVSDEFSNDPKQRRNQFQKEMDRTISKSKQLIKEKSKDRSTYYRYVDTISTRFPISYPSFSDTDRAHSHFGFLLLGLNKLNWLNLCLKYLGVQC